MSTARLRSNASSPSSSPSPSSSSPVEARVVRHADATCAIGTYDAILISAWTASPTVVQINALQRAQRRVMGFPDPLAGIVIVVRLEGGISVPNEAIRKEAAAVYEAVRGRKDVTAVALESRGFMAAAARAFLSGLSLLAGSNNPQKIFDARGLAIDWVVNHLANSGRQISKPDVQRAVEAVVAAIGRS